MSLIDLLQVIVAVILIYLVLSLLASEIQEMLASWLEFRAKNLRESIQILLGEVDDRGKLVPYENTLTQQIYQQPQIKSLNQSTSTFISQLPFLKPSKGPSYLTKEDFADAILEWLNTDPQITIQLTPQTSISALLTELNKIDNLTDQKGVKRLISIAKNTQVKYDQPILKDFRESLCQLFEKAEKRTSGAYKRNAKGVSFLIGLGLAIALNVDSFQIVDQLVKKPQLTLVYNQVAEQVFNQNNEGFNQLLENCFKNENNNPQDCEKQSKDFQKALTTTLDSLEESNINTVIGWSKTNDQSWITAILSTLSPSKMLGWIISGIAMAMGAPFWFDLLGKVINVRNAGKSTTEDKKVS